MPLTNTARKRIMKDIQELCKNPLHDSGIYISHDVSDIRKAYAVLIGPENTPYEDGFYLFEFYFPENYPFEPPKTKFLTHDPNNKTRFHPNLYVEGKVCLSILNTWSGPSWTSVQTFSSVLLSVKSIMDENPLGNEPGFENTSQSNNDNYNGCIRHENMRVAIVFNIRNLPVNFECFKEVLEQHFLKNFHKIRSRCAEYEKKYDGKEFQSGVYNMHVKCDYKKILTEMDELFGDLLPKYPDFKSDEPAVSSCEIMNINENQNTEKKKKTLVKKEKKKESEKDEYHSAEENQNPELNATQKITIKNKKKPKIKIIKKIKA